MKITTTLLVCLLITPSAALAQGARLQLDYLDRLADQAKETVNITIDPAMLKMAAGLIKDPANSQAAIAMLNDLEGIYIRSFEFDRDDAYTQEDVNAVRKQLAAPGWTRLVEVNSKGEQSEDKNGVKTTTRQAELVQIYSWREGNAARGMAILVAEPRELTVINIVGPIDLARLGALQGQFGIPPLPNLPGSGRGR